MPSQYLVVGDATQYGCAANATLPQIIAASALVDSYLHRPKGLIYVPDLNGNPAMMASATPVLNFTLGGSISPGVDVSATLSPGMITPDFVGEVLVFDVGLPSMEACVVINVTPPNMVTLSKIQFSHASGATAATGLTLMEEKALPNKRSITIFSEGPPVNLLSLLGRYAYGRRSDQVGGLYSEMNLLASVQSFGGPPQWIIVDITQASISQRTYELWVPAGMLLAYYSDVRAYYIAGWTAATLPFAIKIATANIVNAIAGTGFPAGIQTATASAQTLKRFTASNIDVDTQRLLDPYSARLMF